MEEEEEEMVVHMVRQKQTRNLGYPTSDPHFTHFPQLHSITQQVRTSFLMILLILASNSTELLTFKVNCYEITFCTLRGFAIQLTTNWIIKPIENPKRNHTVTATCNLTGFILFDLTFILPGRSWSSTSLQQSNLDMVKNTVVHIK